MSCLTLSCPVVLLSGAGGPSCPRGVHQAHGVVPQAVGPGGRGAHSSTGQQQQRQARAHMEEP